VAHDLRTPLRHIHGFITLLNEDHGPKLDEQGQAYIAHVVRGSEQMGRLIDDLLNLSRVGRQQLVPQIVGLRRLVDEVRESLAPEAQGRDVAWEIGELPFVECDAALIRQVFHNLLTNALKFTRPRAPARIEVGAETRDGQTVLFVRDNGVGFNMKYADKLFGVFQRLHRSEDFEGTGVGLVTVQRIIHKHGGRGGQRKEEAGAGIELRFRPDAAAPQPSPVARAGQAPSMEVPGGEYATTSR
jgi:light-regulated signal transduction histidine kinase (bacteriophytochrome)